MTRFKERDSNTNDSDFSLAKPDIGKSGNSADYVIVA